MNSLPHEIIDLIVAGLCPSTEPPKALRLTSSAFARIVKPHLFQTVVLRATPESAEKFINLVDRLGDLDLKTVVRNIIVDLGPAIAQDIRFHAEHTLHAILLIPHFQNVTSVEIKFGYDEYLDKSSGGSPWPTLVEPFITTFSMLPKLQSLLLKDLMVEESDAKGVLNTPEYENLMDRITELDISFVFRSTGMETEPDDGLGMVVTNWSTHRTRFFDDLVETWLSKAKILKSLTLGCDNLYWGANEDFALLKLECPSLESLCLKQFAIHYDAQVDWICSMKSLKHLTLDTVAIIYWRLYPDDFPYNYDYPKSIKDLSQLLSFCFKTSKNKLTVGDRSWRGWEHRYLCLNEEHYNGLVAFRQSYDTQDDNARSVEPPVHRTFLRLDKMDLAALVHLHENLGRSWKFDSSDESQIQRSMLEEPDVQPLEHYATGDFRSEHEYWGFERDEFDESEEFDEKLDALSGDSDWGVVFNLVLNGELEPVQPGEYKSGTEQKGSYVRRKRRVSVRSEELSDEGRLHTPECH